jgi:hypothetical protein
MTQYPLPMHIVFSFFFLHRIQDVGYGNVDGSTKKEGEKGEHDN